MMILIRSVPSPSTNARRRSRRSGGYGPKTIGVDDSVVVFTCSLPHSGLDAPHLSAVAARLPRGRPVVHRPVPVARPPGRLAQKPDPPRPAPAGHLLQRRLPRCRALVAADPLAVALLRGRSC